MTAGPPRDFVGYGRTPPHVEWPDGALVAVNLVVVYEEGAERTVVEGDSVNSGWGEYSEGLDPPLRDLGTESHFEYGSRVGIWRLARLADAAGIPATVSATSLALERNPDVAAWMLERGNDLLGHGRRWLPQWELDREQEAADMDAAIATYERLLQVSPPDYGWNSPWSPSVHTRALLAERGFLYDSDPCDDDLPHWAEATGGLLLVVPYSKTLNDSRYLVSPGFASPRDFVDQCSAALDELLREAKQLGGRMMTVAVHARWTGQPARTAGLRQFVDHALGYERVRFMRRADIARWWIEYGPLP